MPKGSSLSLLHIRWRNIWHLRGNSETIGGLGGGKFLLVMFDEKWFWGLVLRSYAKQVAELGIDPRSFSAYHQNHINKCMVVAVTALAFIDSIENGGIAFKLGLFRAQAHKIARQMVREAVRQADGRIKYCGPVVRKKDDLYLVDCAVTGCSHGTLDNPKFPLKALFENKIFPDVEALVGPGGKFEGYVPIFQGATMLGPMPRLNLWNMWKDTVGTRDGVGNLRPRKCPYECS